MRQRLAILAMDNRLMPYVVSHVIEADHASAGVRLAQEGGDVRALHEAVAGAGTPEVGCDLVDGEPRGASDPGDRLDLDGQYEQPFVQRPVVLEVPDQHRRGVALRARPENRGPRNARNLRLLNLCHETPDRHDSLMQAALYGRCSHLPDHHDKIDPARQQEWHLSPLGHFYNICPTKS